MGFGVNMFFKGYLLSVTRHALALKCVWAATYNKFDKVCYGNVCVRALHMAQLTYTQRTRQAARFRFCLNNRVVEQGMLAGGAFFEVMM